MPENAGILIEYIYKQLKKGNDPEKIKPEEIGMTLDEMISAGKILKEIGWLPEFTVTKRTNSRKKYGLLEA